MSRDPQLAFWLDYVQRQGGLAEEREDGAAAWAVLPESLQRAWQQGEELLVTADPELAEEGALLLAPGHPLLEEAAREVLQRGDAGIGFLPWPTAVPPAPDTLLERVRDGLPVAHGRWDWAGEPAPAYLPLLRVGALAVHTLGERFQERHELWADARTGAAVPPDLVSRWAGLEVGARPEGGYPLLASELGGALARVHRRLWQRAAARGEELAAEAAGEREAERERAAAYYAGQLASLAKRMEKADPRQRSLLEQRAAATRAEEERRLAEIAEKYRPRHELVPYRVQLIFAPGLWLPLAVRRGERCYPLPLGWLLLGGWLSPPPCPKCGAWEPLVAGRRELGCVRCQEQPAPAATEPRAASPAAAAPATPAPRAVVRATARPVTLVTAFQLTAMSGRVRNRVERLVKDFWQAGREGRCFGAVERHSPLNAAYRVWGPEGAWVSLGVLPDWGSGLENFGCEVTGPEEDLHGTVAGALSFRLDFRWRETAYLLRWRLNGNTPVVYELLSRRRRDMHAPVLESLPPPRGILDPVAQRLLGETPRLGVTVVLRLLTIWWRLPAEEFPEPPAAVVRALLELGGAGGADTRRGGRRMAKAADPELAAAGAAYQRLRELWEPLSPREPW
ncbi:MAG: hypothetical protein M0031_07970 [Thermaerobacter sp.]|nr:hypothetical protein [Thermaerobacter sp.]